MRFAVTAPGVFLYYPDRRQVLPKLRAFIEHVRYRSPNTPRDGTTARRSRKPITDDNWVDCRHQFVEWRNPLERQPWVRNGNFGEVESE